MINLLKRNLFFLIGLLFVVTFFYKFFLFGLLPIPTDNIVGLYHPFRDYYSDNYPRGIPFENSLVTDPVRQQYVWKELAISQMKEGQLPLWNPYNFSGYPLLANFQSGVFYPLNFMMFIFPFEYAWTLFIISQPLLAFVFMFLYLRNLKISKLGSLIASVGFSFSGYFVSWLEWGNIVSTGLWLPLVLLSIDRIMNSGTTDIRSFKNKWSLIFIFSLASALFAGHLQTFLYLSLVSLAYFILRLFEIKKIEKIIVFLVSLFLFAVITAIQWVPTLQMINLSARSYDQVSSSVEGWFIPWQNLIQFIAPDFFGNPATLNYWGVWNYGEFIGYIGILPLILMTLALIFIRTRIAGFFKLILLSSILFSFPSFISNIPFALEIPFLSSAQPTRMVYVICFSGLVLAGYGFDYYLKNKSKILFPILLLGAILGLLVYLTKIDNSHLLSWGIANENIMVSFSNLRFPIIIFSSLMLLFIALIFSEKKFKNKRISQVIVLLLILVFLGDIYRFAGKYTVFSKKDYLFPSTKSLDYLKGQEGQFRIMETDSRILPPNFSASYELQSIDGYDPLYLLRYGELVAAIGRNNPQIDPPFGFNRIITPQNYEKNLLNLFNVRFVLSLSDINNINYEKVFEEGETKIYENKKAMDRAFFVERTIGVADKYDAVVKYFDEVNNLSKVAIVENERYKSFDKIWDSEAEAKISYYSPSKVVIQVNNKNEGFLILSDSFYPTWRVSIDGAKSSIYRVNYNFRGVIVPARSTEVIFTNHLF